MRISDWSSDVCSSDLLGWNSYYIDEWPVQKAGLAPDQIQITGSMQLDASKCGLRFMDVYVAQPYPHELKLTIEATSEQEDDILSDRPIDLCEIPVPITARMVAGDLVRSEERIVGKRCGSTGSTRES